MSFSLMLRDVGHGELAGIGSYLRVQDHLHENVAQLLAKVRRVARLDAVDRLVGLLDHVLGNARMRLLAIPRTAVGLAQALIVSTSA